MALIFITTNKHKFEEGRNALKESGIELEQQNMEYDESSDDTIQEIAAKAAKKLADELDKTLIVEDTGVFFDAYPGFPGALPKFVFKKIGYEGLFRLLRGKDRKAHFMSVIGYCEPGKESILFEGRMDGDIGEEVKCKDKDILAYERIFVPEGASMHMCEMAREEKNRISHRASAFRKLGKYLSDKK